MRKLICLSVIISISCSVNAEFNKDRVQEILKSLDEQNIAYKKDTIAKREVSPVKEVEVNCDNVQLSFSLSSSNDLGFGASWETVPKFPDTPYTTKIGDNWGSSIKNFKFKCPSFSVDYNGNILEIVALDYDELLKRIPGLNYLDLYKISGYKYPRISAGRSHHSYSFNINNYELRDDFKLVDEGSELNSTTRSSLSSEVVIGYKLNNGSLKPLLHNNKVYYYVDEFRKADVLDIYHKGSESLDAIQRIYLDKNNATIKIYHNHAFPKN